MASVQARADRRRWVLAKLRRLFADIDDAFARGDHAAAQTMAAEVANLLKEAGALASRNGKEIALAVQKAWVWDSQSRRTSSSPTAVGFGSRVTSVRVATSSFRFLAVAASKE
jgi:hypothetical protein